MQHDLVLRADDVALVPLGFGHAPALLALVDDGLWAGLATPQPVSTTDMERLVLTAWETPGRYAFAVVDAATGQVRGATSLHEVDRGHRRGTIGHTFYGRAWWGGSTNPAAKLALLTLAFDEWGLHRVGLRVDPRNTRSVAAIRRLGAVEEGLLRGYRATADGMADSLSFSILATEWPQVRAGLVRRLAGGVLTTSAGYADAPPSPAEVVAAAGVLTASAAAALDDAADAAGSAHGQAQVRGEGGRKAQELLL